MLRRGIHLLPAVLAWVAVLHAAETPIPEAPTQWVTDTANFLSPSTVETLNQRLAQYQQRTGHQLIVYIAPTTGDAPIEDWAVRAFAKWKVGRKGLDDGLAIFIMTQDHRIRIEVGYGLEPTVPDAIASRVINEVMVPRIQAGQHDQAVTAAIDTLTRVIGGQSGAVPPAGEASRSAPASPMASFLRIVFWVLLIGFVLTHPRIALFFLFSILSGGRMGGGGGGWGGGGFEGGGGRSGGGGASGSW